MYNESHQLQLTRDASEDARLCESRFANEWSRHVTFAASTQNAAVDAVFQVQIDFNGRGRVDSSRRRSANVFRFECRVAQVHDKRAHNKIRCKRAYKNPATSQKSSMYIKTTIIIIIIS